MALYSTEFESSSAPIGGNSASVIGQHSTAANQNCFDFNNLLNYPPNGASESTNRFEMIPASPDFSSLSTPDVNSEPNCNAIGAFSPSRELKATPSTGFDSPSGGSTGISSPVIEGLRTAANQVQREYGDSPTTSSGGENESGGSPNGILGDEFDKNKQCACKDCGKVRGDSRYYKQIVLFRNKR